MPVAKGPWAGKAKKRAKRLEEAKKLLQRAEHRGIWICMKDGILWAEPSDKVSPDFAEEIAQLYEELKHLVKNRRVDGTTDSRLVVFLDPLTADVFSDSEECYEYEQGDFELLEANMAESLVELGICAFHPGPERP